MSKCPRALILGSMPGVKSLAEQQYYAHPQNSFWRIMSALLDAPVETYPQRVALIKNHNLALWDVLQSCFRPGSLDSEIEPGSIIVNDFAAFFRRHPTITQVFFNGATAEKEFRRRVLPGLPEKLAGRLALTRLPSTSPAHAGMKPAAKRREWNKILL